MSFQNAVQQRPPERAGLTLEEYNQGHDPYANILDDTRNRSCRHLNWFNWFAGLTILCALMLCAANRYAALFYNTTGNNNAANRNQVLYANTTGSFNTAIGYAALQNITTGIDTVIGPGSAKNVEPRPDSQIAPPPAIADKKIPPPISTIDRTSW